MLKSGNNDTGAALMVVSVFLWRQIKLTPK
nr:MAG TPA: hypothetical protein [Caudoviricetes sp.]